MLIFPVFIPHRGCPQACIYCDQYQISGVHEPDWNLLKPQIQNFCSLHQLEDKEIAFYGGSFTCLPKRIQIELFDYITPFLNDTTHIRISTRPDGISESILEYSISRGVKTVELGVQDFDDDVLVLTQRGYNRKLALAACKLVKDLGMKLSIQLMPGLPGYSKTSLSHTIEDTITIMPDYVRIYPTIVIAGTPLEKLYRNGEYTPLSLEEALEDTVRMVQSFESNGIKVIKIGLTGIEEEQVIAGPFHSSFGELVKAEIYIGKILQNYEPGQVLNICKSDTSLLLGHQKEYLTRIKYQLNQSAIKVNVSESLMKGEFQYTEAEEFELW
jgi:histone acetyltransferase (RNA polymerase elongator complex component)